MIRTVYVVPVVVALGLVLACSSSDTSSSSSSSGSSGTSSGGTSGTSGTSSSSGTTSTTSTSGSSQSFYCGLNGSCYACPSSQALKDCLDSTKGPSVAGCSSTDASKCP